MQQEHNLTKPEKGNKIEGPVVGKSLSLCISGVLRGDLTIDQIQRIDTACVTPTNRDEFVTEILARYEKSYWSDNPREGTRLALPLYDAGKLTFYTNHDDPKRNSPDHFESEGVVNIWKQASV